MGQIPNAEIYSAIDIRRYITPDSRFERVWGFRAELDMSCFEMPTYDGQTITRQLCDDLLIANNPLVERILTIGLHENRLITQIARQQQQPVCKQKAQRLNDHLRESKIRCALATPLLGQAHLLPEIGTHIIGMNGTTNYLNAYEEPALFLLFGNMRAVHELRHDLQAPTAYTFKDFCEAYKSQFEQEAPAVLTHTRI